MRRGLVVGKFMPLHRGHQLLIETALAQVDELTIVVYDQPIDPYFDKLMPASKRAAWITKLYPNVENVVVLGQPTTLPPDEDHDDPKFAFDYARQVNFLGPFTHVFSSEDYGAPFAKMLEAEHVTVDAARNLVPISGTKIREDLYGNRAYVDPIVYRDLIQKVVFVGTESTGKSTLADAMAQALETNSTLEYGRSLWQKYSDSKIEPPFSALWDVGRTQYEQEEYAVRHANRYLFCDTNAWTTLLWSEMYHTGVADARLVELAERTKDEYIWFLCERDFGWVDDGTRELSGGAAQDFQDENVRMLERWGIPYRRVSGTVGQRVNQVMDDLGVNSGFHSSFAR